MADSKLITAIGEELECPVCAEYFTDACFLTCMHTFCRGCLQKCDKTYGRGGKSSMNCPLCRKVTLLGKNGVGGLLTDYTSNKLVTRLKEGIQERKNAAGASQNGGMVCQSCQEGNIMAYCLSCSHFICASCQSLHTKLGAMRTHEVLPLKELRKGNVTVHRVDNPQFCSLHRLDTVCFCFTCQRYHCDLCCMLDKEGHMCSEPTHNVDSRSAAAMKRQIVEKAVENISKKIVSIGEQKARVKRLRATVRRHFGAMKDNLKSNHDLRLRAVTRVMKAKHDDLVTVMNGDEELIIGKIASVDESLGHTESRALEAKAIGDNAIKDGQHAEIAFVNDYLKCVVSSLNEDDSAVKALTQIEQYGQKVNLTPVPADTNLESLASLGSIFRPDVWDEIVVPGFSEIAPVTSIQFSSVLGHFFVSSTKSISSVDVNGNSSHVCHFPDELPVKDLAVTEDGSRIYVLFHDNRIRIYNSDEWDKHTGVVEIPEMNAEATLSSLALNRQGVLVVGDQASRTVVGCSSNVFKKMTDISPIQMAFTGSGDLAVVCRNIGKVDGGDIGLWNQAGIRVDVRVLGVDERRENVIVQNNWQAAAVAPKSGKKGDHRRFFALGIYVLENGQQLASLAEYDRLGNKLETVFEDKELIIDLENGVQPAVASDAEGSNIAVYSGARLYLFRKRDFSVL